VDRLTIVAYDKFQEIIDEANRADSPIRLQQVILEPAGQHQKLATVVSQSSVLDQIGGGSLESSSSTITGSVTPSSPPVLTTEAEKTIAKIAYDVIQSFENCRVPNSCCKRRFRRKSPHGTKIAQLVFGGFSRCLHPVQKFQSDTERVMAIIADRELAPCTILSGKRNEPLLSVRAHPR
jgi:hypothetical protein